MNIAKMEDVESLIVLIRGTTVLLDADLAAVYGVETREVNQAVANNPEKFPEGYVFELNAEEKQEVIKNFDHLEKLKFSPYLQKLLPKKGFIWWRQF